jgi:hypothetical protein
MNLHLLTGCGFGCQLHHRTSCLMISYALGLPMIHDMRKAGWPFSKRWNDVLRPLGIPCAPREDSPTGGPGLTRVI